MAAIVEEADMVVLLCVVLCAWINEEQRRAMDSGTANQFVFNKVVKKASVNAFFHLK